MSAETTQPQPLPPQQPQPLLAPDHADRLLDRVIHEQVLECVDLEALYHLEQSLALIAGDLDGGGPDHAADLARALIDRALVRLADDARRYLRAVAFMACDGCPLCEAEAAEAREVVEVREPPVRSSVVNGRRPRGRRC